MEQEKINRINELAQLAKERELSLEETKEREILRKEYLTQWRKSAQATLDNTYVLGPDGIKRKLKRK